jgi:hypothetical protein
MCCPGVYPSGRPRAPGVHHGVRPGTHGTHVRAPANLGVRWGGGVHRLPWRGARPGCERPRPRRQCRHRGWHWRQCPGHRPQCPGPMPHGRQGARLPRVPRALRLCCGAVREPRRRRRGGGLPERGHGVPGGQPAARPPAGCGPGWRAGRVLEVRGGHSTGEAEGERGGCGVGQRRWGLGKGRGPAGRTRRWWQRRMARWR